MTPELSDEAVARTTPPGSSRRWVLRAGTVGLFVGGAIALGVGTAAMASAAGPHPKPAAKAPATKSSPAKSAATTSASTTSVAAIGATCSENSFFSGQPAAGSTVTPGQQVKVLYFDESEINPGGIVGKNGVTALPPTFLVNGAPTNTPAVSVGPLFAKGGSSDGFTGQDKYNHVLTVTVPNLAAGTPVGIIAFDGDQNKTGGDCGVINWTIAAAPQTQHVSADLLLCSNGVPTASAVSGGLIAETAGPTAITAAQPIPSTSVATGTYTFHATAPSGFDLVDCGQSSSNDKSVTLSSGDTKTVHFYVQATPPPPGQPNLIVVKTNDANGDGNFSDTETAKAAGATVTFQVQIVNPTSDAVTIDKITDSYASTSSDECASLIGTSLAANSTETCTFTIANYAPAAGTSLTDTVTVTGHNPGGSVTRQDTSTVNTPTPPPPGEPDLAIIKVASLPKVQVGNSLTYTLVVSNVGSGATTGAVTVTDDVPSGLVITGVSGTNWSCTPTGLHVSCSYSGGVIQPGETVDTITITTTVLNTAPTVLVNTGVVKTPGDNNPTNDQSTTKTPVTRVLGTKVVKTPATPAALPFTGSKHTGLLVELALLMLTLGLGLVIAGSSRRRAPVLAG